MSTSSAEAFVPCLRTKAPCLSGARRRISASSALALYASIVVSLLAASAAPTPLYAIYRIQWGLTPVATTMAFGVYAVGVLSSLLVLGKLSDHLGRRPVLLSALAVQILAMIVFATADGLPALLVARTIQGLSTGAALAAIGAGMLDFDGRRGAFANSVSPGIGSGVGALVSGFVVQYLPAPTHLVYLGLVLVFLVQAAGVALSPETAGRKPGALASTRPEIRVPRHLRGRVLTVSPVLYAVWALAGFYASLGPALVDGLVGSTSVVYGGLALFALAGVAALSVVALRGRQAPTLMYTGIGSLVVGVSITLVSIAADSATWFFIGTVIAGVGFGSGFQGGLQLVVPFTAPEDRAGTLSTLYIVSYLGLGIPAVIAAEVVVHSGALASTATWYGIAVMCLALLALIGLARRPATA